MKCKDCKYYAEYESVCCNGNSEKVTDYMDAKDWCDKWEVKDGKINNKQTS